MFACTRIRNVVELHYDFVFLFFPSTIWKISLPSLWQFYWSFGTFLLFIYYYLLVLPAGSVRFFCICHMYFWTCAHSMLYMVTLSQRKRAQRPQTARPGESNLRPPLQPFLPLPLIPLVHPSFSRAERKLKLINSKFYSSNGQVNDFVRTAV